jgi:hypothetical protein
MSEKDLTQPAMEVFEAAVAAVMNASLDELREALKRLDELDHTPH